MEEGFKIVRQLIVPAEIALNPFISNTEKFIYSLIHNIQKRTGGDDVIVLDTELAELAFVTQPTIFLVLKKLKNFSYIETEKGEQRHNTNIIHPIQDNYVNCMELYHPIIELYNMGKINKIKEKVIEIIMDNYLYVSIIDIKKRYLKGVDQELLKDFLEYSKLVVDSQRNERKKERGKYGK